MKFSHHIVGLTVFSRPVRVCAPFVLCLLLLLPGCGGDASTTAAPVGSDPGSAAPAKGELPAGWQAIETEGYGFSVSMPSGEVKKETKQDGTVSWEVTSNDVHCEIVHIPADLTKRDKKFLQKLVDGAVAAKAFVGTVTSQDRASFEGRPGANLWANAVDKDKTLFLHFRWGLVDRGTVTLVVGAETEAKLSSPEVKAIFNSLKSAKADKPMEATDKPGDKE